MAVDAPARAPYASDPATSRGRLHPERLSGGRSAFRRDCDRLIHSTAFRRLAHKTQVFVFYEGDHFRTRLTHTLEVAQVARSLARALGLDEDLAEACALGHDFGHTPFGHAGERALSRCLAQHGGFDHNAQTLRVVTALEKRYPDFDGLNLSWEVLEGLVKHNGPLVDRQGAPLRERGLARGVADYNAAHDLALWSYPSAEAQIGAIADDIAYDAHDIDDGLRAGMFEIGELVPVPLIAEILDGIAREHPRIDPVRQAFELIRRLITRMIEDVVEETRRRCVAFGVDSADAVRAASKPVVGFSAAMAEADRAIKSFLYPRVYRHPRIMEIMGEAETVVADLYAHFFAHPEALPPNWAGDDADEVGRVLRIADYIAGMTDRYAMVEHQRLFGAPH